MVIGRKVPNDVTFNTRVRNEYLGGDNPYEWQEMTTDDYFKGKRVLIFSLPGAFTPTCSTMQLPGFEKHYGKRKEKSGKGHPNEYPKKRGVCPPVKPAKKCKHTNEYHSYINTTKMGIVNTTELGYFFTFYIMVPSLWLWKTTQGPTD